MRLLFLLLLLQIYGGESSAQEAPTFRASTLVVPLEVTVTSPKGKACKNLEARNFKVLEDGKPQKITDFSPKPPPVDITAVLDLSTSMLGETEAIASAARNLVLKIRPGDRIRFVRLSGKGADTSMKAFSGDPLVLNAAIASMVDKDAAGGTTNLKEVMSGVLDGMVLESSSRPQVIVLMSDGQDLISEDAMPHADRVLAELEPKIQNSFATIHTISSGGELLFPDSMPQASRDRIRKTSEEGKTILNRMSSISGGKDFNFSYREGAIQEKLKKIFEQIMIDISSRYSMAYSPNRESDSSFALHKISVEIIGKENCIARTRASYSDKAEVSARPSGDRPSTTKK